MKEVVNLLSCQIVTDEGKDYDIFHCVLAFVMNESLFNNTLTANLVCVDTENIQELLPIVGKEAVHIIYSTDHGDMDFSFDVVSIKDIKSNNQETKTFELELASHQTIINRNIKLKKRVKGSTSDIVGSLLSNELGITAPYLDVEGTSDFVDMVPPSISPLSFINWLCENIGYNGKYSSFYVYRTSKVTSFRSLETMQEMPVIMEFWFYEAKENSVREHQRILKYSLGERFDTITNLGSGTFAGTVYTHDIFNKTLFKDDKKSPNTLQSTRPKYDIDSSISTINKGEDPERGQDPNAILTRGFTKGAFNHHRMMIEIHGNSIIEAGDKIKINIPSTRKGDNKPNDILLSREYIIIKIKHHITANSYKMILELNLPE